MRFHICYEGTKLLYILSFYLLTCYDIGVEVQSISITVLKITHTKDWLPKKIIEIRYKQKGPRYIKIATSVWYIGDILTYVIRIPLYAVQVISCFVYYSHLCLLITHSNLNYRNYAQSIVMMGDARFNSTAVTGK